MMSGLQTKHITKLCIAGTITEPLYYTAEAVPDLRNNGIMYHLGVLKFPTQFLTQARLTALN